ncbi:hypothetical protein [Furfurilactobacillus entadae]|uniref:hypothetical protein n=1 Tax=Furfurilactobacillus entadae TaxID=2922307 RepID=UPI0035E4BAA4
MAVTQTERNKKWANKNKAHASYLSDRSRARSFIRNKATVEDLKELLTLIDEKQKTIQQDEQNS